MTEELGGSLLGGFVASAADAMIVTDAKGHVVVWNTAAEALFGYSAAEVVGRPMDFVVPIAMRGEHTAGMARLASGGAPRLIGKPVRVPALRADGSTVEIELRLTTWRDKELFFGAVIREVESSRGTDDILHNLAHFDQLTMLPNRRRFLSRLGDFMASGAEAGILMVNFDRFAEVNDRLGAEEADDLLRRAAAILKRFTLEEGGPDGFLGRLGPNEFALCLPDARDVLSVNESANKLKARLQDMRGSDGRPITASIGAAAGAAHGESAGRIIANADFAMRRAKLLGGDRCQIFQPQQREIVRVRQELEFALKSAWDRGEFEVHYQPQIRLSDGAPVGAEALLRWRHPTRGLVLPGLFMHALQDSELATLVGDFVIEDACRRAAEWGRAAGRPIRVGVNLFERQFMRADQPERVERALADAGLSPDCLELEIIETIMTSSDEASIRRVRRLRDIGVGIAFDDYGTGYASLGLLKRYPLTTLKIDRAFVRDITEDKGDRTIVELVLTLGRRFGFRVVAEGVETREQADMLRALDCEEAQGFLFGRPGPATAFAAFLNDGAAPDFAAPEGALVA
ncbi:EAL domain-containing protein [Chelatococcus sambhunathii]|uniref:EAL domain-containing protein n=1 Tax=Chelatococcus sambhunathii TaxID=363953 RepID=A0ABU1DBU9_9HYPH|nr:EAL domain-containing protein [Chelatococcus sambhunathii]MDR4305545.1 EAL domain-containing protein [Chelatococcus sambhunathii]